MAMPVTHLVRLSRNWDGLLSVIEDQPSNFGPSMRLNVVVLSNQVVAMRSM